MQYVKTITKEALTDLMKWSFLAGKNEVSDEQFAKALERTIKDMNFEILRWNYEHEL